jgi:hypothetical protein
MTTHHRIGFPINQPPASDRYINAAGSIREDYRKRYERRKAERIG